MRRAVFLTLLLSGFGTASAQGAIHEYRPEIVLTLPRYQGYGIQLLLEQHLVTSDLALNEGITGVGLVSPSYNEHFSVRFAVEARQVKKPTELERRYIPTMFSTVHLGGAWEMRNRTRMELRDVDGTWSRRYQNRSAVGRDIHMLSLPVFTYAQLDLSYDSRYSSLNRIDKAGGLRIPIITGTSIDLFFMRQDDTRRTPRALYATGAILRMQL